ncbi:hypothetical protein [Ensifer aridi]|uniref:hypothetical protein n=1 Tax=Ensifer aridi TaxID=1708715 RepID=UPI00358F4C13
MASRYAGRKRQDFVRKALDAAIERLKQGNEIAEADRESARATPKEQMRMDAVNEEHSVGNLVSNVGEPIRLKEMDLAGISAAPAKGGDTAKIWTRMSLTSDEVMFHAIAENISGVLMHAAHQNGASIKPDRVDTLLLVIRPDNSAELWADTAAVAMQALLNRSVPSGAVILESDIADIVGMWFPMAGITEEDRILCLFRTKWSFGLFFDFHREKPLDIEAAKRDLGTLHRRLYYRHLYEMVENQLNMQRLAKGGWFPFAEIIGREFGMIANHSNAEFDLSEIEEKILAALGDARIEKIFSRWMVKPAFQDKEKILRPAIDAFKRGEPVIVLKTLLTEIEGVLQSAHRQKHRKSAANLKALFAFAAASAEERAGTGDSLLFPSSFVEYLRTYTFDHFDPDDVGETLSRHSVGHGAAGAESYTPIRALQAILTLDQLAFYL